MNILTTLAFLLACGAFWYAWDARRLGKRAVMILEGKHLRTVVIDTQDGKVTIVREEYDADRP